MFLLLYCFTMSSLSLPLNSFAWLAVLIAFSLAVSTEINALTVVDQNGVPVPGAVVILPATVQATPDEIAIMDQQGKQFVPEILLIQKNQAVNFPNSDDIRHHVYSFSEPKTFEIKLYSGVPASPVIFDKLGVVVLGCNIHDQMVGYIVVVDNQLAGMTDTKGQWTLPSGPLPAEIVLWHPRLAASLTQLQWFPITSRDEILKLQLKPVNAGQNTTRFGNRFQRHGS